MSECILGCFELVTFTYITLCLCFGLFFYIYGKICCNLVFDQITLIYAVFIIKSLANKYGELFTVNLTIKESQSRTSHPRL